MDGSRKRTNAAMFIFSFDINAQPRQARPVHRDPRSAERVALEMTAKGLVGNAVRAIPGAILRHATGGLLDFDF